MVSVQKSFNEPGLFHIECIRAMFGGYLRYMSGVRARVGSSEERTSFCRTAGKYGQAITNEGLNEITSNWSLQIKMHLPEFSVSPSVNCQF